MYAFLELIMLIRRDKNEQTNYISDPLETTDLRAVQKHLQSWVRLDFFNAMAFYVERKKTKLLSCILSKNCLENSIQNSLVNKQIFRRRNL